MSAIVSWTHDRQPVYAADAPLPEGAVGWTQCDNRGGGYATWINEADRPLHTARYVGIEEAARALRTKAAASAALAEIGLRDFGGTLREMRVAYQVRRFAQAFPLRDASGDCGTGGPPTPHGSRSDGGT